MDREPGRHGERQAHHAEPECGEAARGRRRMAEIGDVALVAIEGGVEREGAAVDDRVARVCTSA